MSQLTAERNPFMLMLHPEAVLAAVEKSERLGALNRHQCRPLDRIAPTTDKDGKPAQVAEEDFDA
jgi:hypothetical protein